MGKWRILAVLLVMAGLLSVASSRVGSTAVAAAPTADPSCTGYAEPRWNFESQVWWGDTGVGYFDAEHVHVSLCFPHQQQVSGVVPFDVTIKLHNNPGSIAWFRVQVWQTLKAGAPNCHGGGLACLDFSPALTCPSGTCTFGPYRVNVPTQYVAYDGRQEFRFLANTDLPSGKKMYQSSGWKAKLANGNPTKDYDPGYWVEGRGWYTDTEYIIARKPVYEMAPVSGLWSFAVVADTGSGGTPTTEHEVLVDPDIHMGSRGTIIKAGSGSYRGSVTVDTTKLANGWHKLMIRAGSTVATGTASGIQVVPFLVQN